MIRDNALAVSGLLVQKIGGPSVKPYQPSGLWQETTGGGGGTLTKYIEGKGEHLYRRSLYTFWKRTVPPPSMMTFDTASRDFCEVKRQKTNTPLQALVLLNDPQYIEAARVLATNILQNGFDNDEEKVNLLFRTITSRYPDKEELIKMTNYLEESVETISLSNGIPESLLSIGETPLDADINKEELFKYTILASVLLNLEETNIKS